jgi:hypothetical protein
MIVAQTLAGSSMERRETKTAASRKIGLTGRYV